MSVTRSAAKRLQLSEDPESAAAAAHIAQASTHWMRHTAGAVDQALDLIVQRPEADVPHAPAP